MRRNLIYDKGNRRKGRQGNQTGPTPGQAKSAERKAVRRKAKAWLLKVEAARQGISVTELRSRRQKEVDACRVNCGPVLIRPSRRYEDYY